MAQLWCGDRPLKLLFPDLFNPAVDRNATVADYQEQGSQTFVWAPVFVKDRFIKDDSSLLVFFEKLNQAKLGDFLTDKVRWFLKSNECFTVRSFYLKLLDGCGSLSLGTISEGSFPHKLIWRTLAPIKVSFFV